MAVSKDETPMILSIRLDEWLAEKAEQQQSFAQIKALERGLKFSQNIETQLRARIEHLERLCAAKDALIGHLQSSVRFNSARYSEGGSGDFINNSRFEPAEETDNAA